jgi:hypothetical protein
MGSFTRHTFTRRNQSRGTPKTRPSSILQRDRNRCSIEPRQEDIYPIYNGVPRLLTFPTGVADNFTKQYAEGIRRDLPGFITPHEPATPADITFLVENGRNGFVIHRGDETTFAERDLRLLADDELCRKMGLAARAKAEQEFGL